MFFVAIVAACAAFVGYKYRNNIATIYRLLGSLKNPVIESSDCVINGNYAKLTYNYRGTQYNIIMPFSRNYAVDMIQFRVELLKKDDIVMDITQQAGLPYLFNAESLGGYDIRIINDDNGKIYNYGSKNSPGYGIEVME